MFDERKILIPKRKCWADLNYKKFSKNKLKKINNIQR